jgi:adenylate cyclase
MALLHITDASGRQWQHALSEQAATTIGRAPDNQIILNDGRASRYHAHVQFKDGAYLLVDGVGQGAQLKRSANKVFVNGQPRTEHRLADGDQIIIGASLLRFAQPPPEPAAPDVRYNDTRLGHSQLLIPAEEVLRGALRTMPATASAAELAALRRKAEVLALLYEMSKTLSSVFDLDAIFDKATEIIFRVTPADRVVALLRDEGAATDTSSSLRPVSTRVRPEKAEKSDAQLSVSRTITNKVMRERAALLSQDAAAEAQFAAAHSIIVQGVRSTICAPLLVEAGAHGVIYADRLDPTAVFTRDDLELVSAVAAQAAVAVETARAHARLAREEVARANYARFMPDYVVRQLLERPDSFKLGGVNQTVTVLFADVRGFTRLSEHTPPEQVVLLLNRYFTAMTEVIFAHGGTLDKYIGDGLMALFGAPAATPADTGRAVAAAVHMQRRVAPINTELRAAGLPEISIGIGLHTGPATVGYIGSERRTEYTAIGDTVNLAARLEQNARGGEILLSETAAKEAACPYTLRARPPLTVKNRVQPVAVYEVEWREAAGES